MRRRGVLGAIILVAVLARLAVVTPRWGTPPDDPDNYLALARSLAAGEGYRLDNRATAYRPPLYPLVLAPLIRLFGPSPTAAIFALHLALGAATVVLTARTAERWGLPPSR